MAHTPPGGLTFHYLPSTPPTGAPAPTIQDPPGHPSLAGVPTFTPSLAGSTPLDLLASVAADTLPTTGAVGNTAGHSTATGTAAAPSLLTPGPYNPAASIPARVVRKILDLEFVDMSEVSAYEEPIQTPGRAPLPAEPPVTDISRWLERYSIMAAILSSRFPEKAPELWAYQASIIRAERNYVGRQWAAYDRQFRRQALARKDLNWSVPDPRLYNEAFTGRARYIQRCGYCLQEGHSEDSCHCNPHRRPPTWMQEGPWSAPPPPRPPTVTEICRRYNDGRCRKPSCRYRHACTHCQGAHPLTDCPARQQAGRQASRSRSPLRSTPRPLPGQGF